MRVYLRGSAFDSSEGNNTFLMIDGQDCKLPKKRGLNTMILHPDGSVKKSASFDTFGTRNNWLVWADFIQQHAEPGDIVATATFDASWHALPWSSVDKFLRSIDAIEAYRFNKGISDWRVARTPYALLFIMGETSCWEAAQPYGGPNAHIEVEIAQEETQQGVSRPCLEFDGQGDYLSAELDVPETDYTVSIWFKTDHRNCGLFSVDAGDRGAQGHDRHLYLNDGHLCARLWSNEVIRSKGVNYADNQWHHLTHVIGKSVNGQQLYVDGVLVAQGQKAQSDFGQQTGINIGFSNDASSPYFKGQIAEVSIWSIVRSQRDLRVWKEQVIGHEEGLEALWAFSFRQESPMKDLSKQAHLLTSHGNPVWTSTDNFPGAFLLQQLPPDLEGIRSEAESLASVGGRLGKGYEQDPPEDLPKESLPELITKGKMPQYGLFRKALGNVKNDRLHLSKALLDDFVVVGNEAAGILDLFFTIQDPEVRFIKGEPGMVGDPGMEIAGEQGGEKLLATPEDHKLRISGSIELFNRAGFHLQSDFFRYKGKNRFAFRIESEEPLGIGAFLKDVPLLNALKLESPVFIVANAPTLYDPQLDAGVNEGFNFYGAMDIGESRDPGMRFIGGLLQVDALAVHAAIDRSNPAATSIILEASLKREIPIIKGASFELSFTRTDLGITLTGMPPEPAIAMSQDLAVKLDYGSQRANLIFTGGIKLEAESATGAFTMNGTGRHPEGELTGTVQNSGEWKEPFGIPGVVIRQMAVQLGGTYAAPWIDNIGIHGNLKIGDIDGSISILVDSNDPDQFVLAGTTDRMTLLQLMSTTTPATFITYQALPAKLKKVLNKLIDVKMEDVKVNIVPYPTSIGGVHFRDQGFTVAGRLSAWGWEAMAYVNIDPKDGMVVQAEMEPVNILDVFRIKGGGDQAAPVLKTRITPLSGQVPSLLLASEIYLLGLSREMEVEADENGFSFLFKQNIGRFLQTHLNIQYSDYNFSAEGNLDFELKATIPTPFGHIRLDTGMDVDANMRAGKDHGFLLQAKAGFRFQGAEVRVPELHLKVAPRDFEGIYQALVKQIRDHGRELFMQFFGTLGEWVLAVKDGIIDFGGEVADVAKNIYKVGMEEAAQAYKALGKAAGELAGGLKKIYGATDRQVAQTLKKLNYTADQIAGALKDAFGYGSDQVARVLREVGYTAEQIAYTLKRTFRLGEEEIGKVLKRIGYSVEEVGRVMEKLLNLSVGNLSSIFAVQRAVMLIKTLQKIGFNSREVGRFLKNAKGFGASLVASLMSKAGYGINTVGDTLRELYRLSDRSMARALKAGFNSAKEVGNYLRRAYRISDPKRLKGLLESAGFSGKDIERAFKEFGGKFADAVKDLFGKIGDIFGF